MSGSRRLLALALGLLILATACGRKEEMEVSHDLIAEFPWAVTWGETREVDFGKVRGRRHLVSGWSIDEWDHPRRSSFVWGLGEESILEVDVPRALDLVLKLRCRPAPLEGGQRVEVILNDLQLGGFDLRDRLAWYQLSVDGEWLRPGLNELRFQYSDHVPAGEDPTGDPRPRAVAWYELSLESEVKAELSKPELESDRNALALPPGTGVEYNLRLAPASVLEIGGVDVPDENGGTVEVSLQVDGEDSVTSVGSLTRSKRSRRLDLGGDRSRVVRLTLQWRSTDDDSIGGSSVIVEGPIIRSPERRISEALSQSTDSVVKGEQRRPNILLYVVDTLRADHLGIYGYQRPVSPQIDAFASQATIFDDAVAQSSWTRASMASIFTGLWPLQHATNRRGDVLAPEAETLAELLRDAGYRTVAFAKNQDIFPTFGFSQGFNNFNAMWTKGKSHKINAKVEKWLKSYSGDRPFFLYLHAVDPHAPYGPPADFKDRFAKESNDDLTLKRPPSLEIWRELRPDQQERILGHLLDLYDGEIAYNDATFGSLLETLRQHSVYEDTMIILLSDHGEEFQDHGNWQHGRNLFVENLHVPLVIRFPDLGHGLRVSRRVQHIDLLPTLLEYLGVDPPDALEGTSFLSWVSDPEEEPVGGALRPAYSFLHLDGLPNVTVIEGDWKLVQNWSKGKVAWTNLYNLVDDPGETRNRARERPIRASYLSSLIAKRRSEESLLVAGEAVLDERMEEALKALGYIN